ncbi:MAG TPA: SIR2 family protein [Blastocatellia bacterium]|nr:SIR2 family protein [Blastocatellia bacterium]
MNLAPSPTAHLPTAGELACYLAQMTDFPHDEPLDLAKVAQYYSLVGGRSELYRELHSIFDEDFPLSPLHTYLAQVPVPVLIVTTNYDDLIERAFEEVQRPYDLVIHTTDPELGDQLLWRPHGTDDFIEKNPNKLDIELDQVTVIYKMHGTVDRRRPSRDQFVITENDYVDFLTRMTKNKAIPAIFAEPFQTRAFLFLGYSLRDWNLRVVLNRIENEMQRKKGIKSWGIQYRPSPLESRFWQDHNVETYGLTIDEFINQLARTTQA